MFILREIKQLENKYVFFCFYCITARRNAVKTKKPYPLSKMSVTFTYKFVTDNLNPIKQTTHC